MFIYGHAKSVFTLPKFPSPISCSTLTFNLPNNAYFSVVDVFHQLISSRGFSLGPNGIPGDFFFNLRDTLFWPLWFLFRKSLDDGILPSILKISSLLPILKTSDPSNVMNYRPTDITSHVAKNLRIISFFLHPASR